jgi:predicted amidophosphoribosyltransferase
MMATALRNCSVKFALCPICSGLPLRGAVFCRYCSEPLDIELRRGSELMPPQQNNLTIKPLFLWDQMSSPILRSLIYALKGGQFPGVYLWLAKQFCNRYQFGLTAGKAQVLVPVPGRKNDHAATWCWAVSQTLRGCTYRIGQVASSRPAQKRFGRLDRSKVRHQPRQNQIRGKRRLFTAYNAAVCDDVVTTGSTALATANLVDIHHRNEVWCIAYRPKLSV